MRIQAWDWNDESTATTKGQYQRVIDLKKVNPQLKVLLAVGGWTFGSQVFSQMVNNPISRAIFTFSAINFLKSNGFDGLDLDWEFPAYGTGSSPQDKYFFSVFVEEVKQAFIPHGLMLTASVAVNPKDVDAGYEVDRIARSLDFVTLMTYNYHGSWDSYTGFNAPLYARPNESGQDRLFNVDYGVNYWLNKGLPREKLIVGTSMYGRSFRLNSPLNNKPGDAAYSVGTQGQWTKDAGILSYYEICQKLAQGWKRGYSLEQRVPYADNGNEWIGYDDVQSIKEKADYINIKGLGGILKILISYLFS
jgi:chitinase